MDQLGTGDLDQAPAKAASPGFHHDLPRKSREVRKNRSEK
jgi:hypothetical protein